MASLAFNGGIFALFSKGAGSVDWLADDIEVVAMKSTYVPNQDDDYTVLAAGELVDAAGYDGGYGGADRKLLANKTLTKDNATDRVKFDADDPTAYPIVAGQTVGGFIIQKKGAADDTTAIPLFFVDAPDTPTNGAPLQLQFAAAGIYANQQ